MRIQCTCGKFQADVTDFTNATPGRLGCYCDDCQAYMAYLGRKDLLDSAGGTEVIPVYPAHVKFLSGREQLKCTRLSDKGMFRFSTTCCNTPVGNTRLGGPPWLGLHRVVFLSKDPNLLDRTLGDVKSRIMGKFARGQTPPGTPDKMDFKGFRTVMPFMLKGLFGGKGKGSPFFSEDGKTPIVKPTVLTAEERAKLR